MRCLLIGKKNSKRYEYFKKACETKKVEFYFYDIEGNLEKLLTEIKSDDIIKIDPISHKSAYLNELNKNISFYKKQLKILEKLPKEQFLNSPQSILNTLDKKNCKNILKKTDISITPILDFNGRTWNELLKYMKEKKVFQVFLKMNFASGAAGLIALKYNPKQEKYLAKTSIGKMNNEYINIKKIKRLNKESEIKELVEFLLSEDYILEYWIPKDSILGISYDLRILWQNSKISFIQVRGSTNQAITNLHLNNLPLSLESLNLKEETLLEISDICKKATKLFDGLETVGFDILLEKNSKKPYIIEMNAQGDLMYQDIFNSNSIYLEQVERMKQKWQKN